MGAVARWFDRQTARPWSAQLLPAAAALVALVVGVLCLDSDPAGGAILLVVGILDAVVIGAILAAKRRSRRP